jgi:DNA polymerase III sliding clamp (beta) subunit (PCNA family)
MEFKIETSELKYVIKLLSAAVVPSTTDGPGRILIAASQEGVLFLVNNNSVAIEYLSTTADVKTEGKTAIIFSKLQSFILPFNNWNDKFGSKETKFKIKQKGLEKSVFVYVDNVLEDGTNFDGELKLSIWDTYSIQRPKPFNKANFILNCGLMKSAVAKVLYAVNPDEVREYLQNVKVEFKDDVITFVGTNGVSLSEYEMPNLSSEKNNSFILKYDLMSALEKTLPLDDTQLFIEVTPNRIKAKFNDILIEGSQVIGREYPPHKTALSAFSDFLKLNKKSLLNVLVPAQGILDSDDHFRLTIEVKDGKLNLYNDNVKFKSSMDLAFDGDFVIDVNGQLVKKAIESIIDDEVLMKFSNATGVLIFDSANYENQKSLITPIRRR